MKPFKFAIAVAATSLALVVIAGAAFALATPIGAVAAQSALGKTPWMGGAPFGPPGFGPPGFQLPPEFQGLSDLPPAERFAHFVGLQVNLKDKDNKAFTVSVTPGSVTAASANSLTVAANDGANRTFTLSSTTVMLGKPDQGGSPAAQQRPASGDKVIVITTSSDQTALALIDIGAGDFGPGFGGPPWAYFGPGFAGPPWAHWGQPGWQR